MAKTYSLLGAVLFAANCGYAQTPQAPKDSFAPGQIATITPKEVHITSQGYVVSFVFPSGKEARLCIDDNARVKIGVGLDQKAIFDTTKNHDKKKELMLLNDAVEHKTPVPFIMTGEEAMCSTSGSFLNGVGWECPPCELTLGVDTQFYNK